MPVVVRLRVRREQCGAGPDVLRVVGLDRADVLTDQGGGRRERMHRGRGEQIVAARRRGPAIGVQIGRGRGRPGSSGRTRRRLGLPACPSHRVSLYDVASQHSSGTPNSCAAANSACRVACGSAAPRRAGGHGGHRQTGQQGQGGGQRQGAPAAGGSVRAVHSGSSRGQVVQCSGTEVLGAACPRGWKSATSRASIWKFLPSPGPGPGRPGKRAGPDPYVNVYRRTHAHRRTRGTGGHHHPNPPLLRVPGPAAAGRTDGQRLPHLRREHVRLLEQIRTLQDFGFGLEETRPFVECLRAGHTAGDTCAASLAVYRRKLAEIDAWVDHLTCCTRRGRRAAAARGTGGGCGAGGDAVPCAN